MADKITWANKESLVTDPTILEKNKVTDSNMNEIKSVTNNNADELDELIVEGEENITENTKAVIKEGVIRHFTEISNTYGTSESIGYSQKYENAHNVIVSPTEPTTSERVWFKKSNNLLNLSNAETGTKNGITFSVDTTAGTITLSGTSTSYTAFNIPINLSGKNTFSCDNWGQFTIYLQYNGSGVKTITSNAIYDGNVDNMVIGINGSVTINKTIKLQVEKGETATTYEPYVEYKSIQVDNKTFTEAVSVGTDSNNSRVWFKKGINLVDKSTILKMTTINATTGLPESTSNFSFATQLIKVKPNTDYYVKAGPVVIYAYDTNKTFMSIIKNNAQAGTFNTGSAEYIRGRNWWANNTNEMNTQINNAFIYEGTTDTTYEPYITPSISVDNEEIYSKPVILWTNSAPTSDFAGQEVTLSDSIANYSYYEVIFKRSTTADYLQSTGKIIVGHQGVMQQITALSQKREVSIATNKATFTDGVYYGTYGTNTTTTQNSIIIPLQVIGYK